MFPSCGIACGAEGGSLRLYDDASPACTKTGAAGCRSERSSTVPSYTRSSVRPSLSTDTSYFVPRTARSAPGVCTTRGSLPVSLSNIARSRPRSSERIPPGAPQAWRKARAGGHAGERHVRRGEDLELRAVALRGDQRVREPAGAHRVAARRALPLLRRHLLRWRFQRHRAADVVEAVVDRLLRNGCGGGEQGQRCQDAFHDLPRVPKRNAMRV